eukprot:6940588-Pyramimonas_sp.AAC.1
MQCGSAFPTGGHNCSLMLIVILVARCRLTVSSLLARSLITKRSPLGRYRSVPGRWYHVLLTEATIARTWPVMPDDDR